MTVNQFIYNGKSSYEDFKLIITETPHLVFAERDIESISIPGKNEELLYDKGKYKNVIKEYKVTALGKGFLFTNSIQQIAEWLDSKSNYYVLTDSYDPKYYRLANANQSLSFTSTIQKMGTATIKFNCKPFKYSFDGKNTVTFVEAGVLYNAEIFNSKPYLKIFANGDITVNINDKSFNFTGINEYIEIDSEVMNAYKGIELQNNKMTSLDFPEFSPGENNISWVGNVEKIEIIPRWCTL